MNSFALRWVVVAALLIVPIAHAGTPPAGILIREKGKDDCCATRLELTAEGQAFCLESRDPVPGTVTEVDGKLQVEMGGKIRWTLAPEGNGWVDQEKQHWVPRESVVKIDPSWTVVRIRVVDQNKKPLEAFGYEYAIGGKDGDWDSMLVRPLPGKGGVVELKAPSECKITLSIDHPDFNRGYGSGSELDRKKGVATLVAKFNRGHTIRGKVVNDATGKPLTGATVSPLIFTPPGFSKDPGRSAVTGTSGTFELRGVESSFAVNHPDFLDQEIYLDENIRPSRLKCE